MDLFKLITAALTAVAGVLVYVLPPNTIGHHIAQGVVGLGAAGGILSAGTSNATAANLARAAGTGAVNVSVAGKLP